MNPFVADPHWGWWIVFYFFLGGIASGAFFLASLINLFGKEEDRPIARVGYWIAFPLVSVCGILLILDLDRPERFWHMLFQSEIVRKALREGWPLGGWGTMQGAIMFKLWSPMSIGAWALMIFSLCAFTAFVGSLWPRGRVARWFFGTSILGRGFQILGSLVGFFIASYTGVLLTATNQPLWSLSNWVGPLFLTSAASTGIAMVILAARWKGDRGDTTGWIRLGPETVERLERADLWALGMELLVFLIFLASLGPGLAWLLQTVHGWVFVVGTLGIGLLLPLAAHLGLSDPNPRRVTLAAGLALVGGFLLRFGLLGTAPELLHRWEYETPAPDQTLGETWVGAVLLIGTLVLAVAIPWLLRRQWRLSMGQTSLAGLVSLLVLAGVILYAREPLRPRHAWEPFSAFSISPEDQRPRGGGVGASGQNRPAELHLRTKFDGTAFDDQP